jgi:predicted metal-dependent enzyme (double-stranded beta helix superfamily)
MRGPQHGRCARPSTETWTVALAYSIDNLIVDMDGLLTGALGPAALVDTAAGLLERLVADPAHLPDRFHVPGERPGKPSHSTFLLYRAPSGWSMTAVVWGAGDFAPPHDHRTWGLFGVIENQMEEARFRRLDDGSDTARARIERTREHIVKSGSVSMLVPGSDDIHAMNNPSGRPTVEIHIYGRDLKGLERSRFDPETGHVSRFITERYDNDEASS